MYQCPTKTIWSRIFFTRCVKNEMAKTARSARVAGGGRISEGEEPSGGLGHRVRVWLGRHAGRTHHVSLAKRYETGIMTAAGRNWRRTPGCEFCSGILQILGRCSSSCRCQGAQGPIRSSLAPLFHKRVVALATTSK